MYQGTPEARLWSAVVLAFIDDCRDDLSTTTSIDNIERAASRWRGRASERSFRHILDSIDVPHSKLISWINSFERRSKRAALLGYWDDDVLQEDGPSVIGRGQKRAY